MVVFADDMSIHDDSEDNHGVNDPYRYHVGDDYVGNIHDHASMITGV